MWGQPPSAVRSSEARQSFFHGRQPETLPFARPASGPLKPDFGLSGDVSIFSTLSIPTGTDHRKAMICGVEGPAVVDVIPDPIGTRHRV